MDPKLVFWSLAFIDMGAVIACAALGWRRIQQGDVAGHKRCMGWAGFLLFAFLLAYCFKVPLVGKEDTSGWSSLQVWVLRLHETWVAVMLLSGLAAWRSAHAFVALRASAAGGLVVGSHRQGLSHRLVGYTAFVSAGLAFVFAVALFAIMFLPD